MAPAVEWRALLVEARGRLAQAGVATPDVDARRILEQATGYEAADLPLHLGEPASALGAASVERMVDRRCAGEPLQYVLGAWSFRSLDLYLDRRALIPRPETEVLAELGLRFLARVEAQGRLRAVDLGTGSGAIALSLVAENERVEVIATDLDPGALEVARANLAGLGRPASRVRLAEGDWFSALPPTWREEVHLLISNPPYISASEPLPDEVANWEPEAALIAGPAGTEALVKIVDGAGGWLHPGGALMVELAPHQAEEISARASEAGFRSVEVHRDLAGRERVLVASEWQV